MQKGNGRHFRTVVVIACILAVVVIYDRVSLTDGNNQQSPLTKHVNSKDHDVAVTKLLLMASGLRSRITITDPPFTWVSAVDECNNFISTLATTHGFAASIETQIFRTILLEQCKKLDANGRPPLVVDVGGNAGYFTTYAAAMGCRVIAFEPFPRMMNFLELHVALNNLGDLVTAVPSAVSSTKGVIYLTPVCTDFGFSYLTDKPGDGKIKVNTVRLSDVLKEDVLLLKIDVEGFEDHVFRGMEEFLKKYQVKNVICETKKNGDIAYKLSTINSFISRNYTVYSYPEHYGADAPFPVDTNVHEKVLIPLSSVSEKDWIPFEDLFYTMQKNELAFNK